MKTVQPSKTLVILSATGAAVVFLLGAAAWHALIQADPPGCTENEIVCLFVPSRVDFMVHLVSYALMTPLMLAFFFWLFAWRSQWTHLKKLTRNLAAIVLPDEKLHDTASALGLEGRVYLVDSEDYFSFCVGFVKPRIFISQAVADCLTREELSALLLHEKHHVLNRDPLKVLFCNTLKSALFFSPAIKDLYRAYLVRKEIAADQFAIRCQGQRRGIISTLRKLLEHQADIARPGLSVAGTEALAQRVNFILGRPSPAPVPLSHIALSAILPGAALAAAILVPLTTLHL
jgi:Zn-dependent protease with chaperone function